MPGPKWSSAAQAAQARTDAAYCKATAVSLNRKEQAVYTELQSHKFSAALAAPK